MEKSNCSKCLRSSVMDERKIIYSDLGKTITVKDDNDNTLKVYNLGEQKEGTSIELYHAPPSLEIAYKIQADGFDLNLSGNKEGELGVGVYMSTDLQKAMNYAEIYSSKDKENPHEAVVLKLLVDLGNCIEIEQRNDPIMKTWHENGYDSCWFHKVDQHGVYCIRDTSRIQVIDMFLGRTLLPPFTNDKVYNSDYFYSHKNYIVCDNDYIKHCPICDNTSGFPFSYNNDNHSFNTKNNNTINYYDNFLNDNIIHNFDNIQCKYCNKSLLSGYITYEIINEDQVIMDNLSYPCDVFKPIKIYSQNIENMENIEDYFVKDFNYTTGNIYDILSRLTTSQSRAILYCSDCNNIIFNTLETSESH